MRFIWRLPRRTAGSDVAIEIDGARHDVALPLIGDFQIENLTLALGMAQAAGMDSAIMLEACRDLQAPRGRSLQLADRIWKSGGFVDYAHTPDALENAMTALRRHVPEGGRLLVMFMRRRPAMATATQMGLSLPSPFDMVS